MNKQCEMELPVRIEQIDEYLFSDTVHSQKTKSGVKKPKVAFIHDSHTYYRFLSAF